MSRRRRVAGGWLRRALTPEDFQLATAIEKCAPALDAMDRSPYFHRMYRLAQYRDMGLSPAELHAWARIREQLAADITRASRSDGDA